MGPDLGCSPWLTQKEYPLTETCSLKKNKTQNRLNQEQLSIERCEPVVTSQFTKQTYSLQGAKTACLLRAKSLQSCLTFCNPMDCGPPGSSVHGILQARVLEWVAVPSSRGSSPPRDRTCIF